MEGLYFMLPLAVMLALGFLKLFFWSMKNGDMEDPESSRYQVLLDNEDDIDNEIR